MKWNLFCLGKSAIGIEWNLVSVWGGSPAGQVVDFNIIIFSISNKIRFEIRVGAATYGDIVTYSYGFCHIFHRKNIISQWRIGRYFLGINPLRVWILEVYLWDLIITSSWYPLTWEPLWSRCHDLARPFGNGYYWLLTYTILFNDMYEVGIY